MKKAEILELMKLRGWSKTKLAGELDLTESTVHRWLAGDTTVSGPASILMRMWLEESRREMQPAAAS